MKVRHSIGGRLSWVIVASTALGLALFAAAAAIVFWVQEQQELVSRTGIEEDPVQELASRLGISIGVAAPIALLIAVLITRWASARVTRRIDTVVEIAATMTAENLRQRLPVGRHGDELDALARTLNALFARVESAIAAQRQFAADASHELRTPIAVVITELEVARRRTRAAEAWEAIADRSLDELRRMAAMIEALLQSARAGAFDVTTELCNVDDLVAEIVDRWRERASQARVRIEPSEPTSIRTRLDARAITIALDNIVANAIAHSPEGGTVRIEASGQREWLELTVDDQGPGVRTEDRERIFAPFARAQPPRDRAHGQAGVGLGLSIAQRIVEAHGGTIVVEDAPTTGARFRVRLPRERTPTSA